MAPLDKFESLCSELDSALKREQQAQQLLNEQSQQLQVGMQIVIRYINNIDYQCRKVSDFKLFSTIII